MRRKTKVRIQRAWLLVKLLCGTVWFVWLMCRFERLRHFVSLFIAACIMTAVWQYADWREANGDDATEQ